MIKSMTGYGHAEVTEENHKFTVEIKSVNNRYLDINIRLPRQFNAFEAQIRSELKKWTQRGKVDVYIFYENLSGAVGTVQYNSEIARQYYDCCCRIAEEFGLDSGITVSQLAGCPEVLKMEEHDPDTSDLWGILQGTLERAAVQFVDSRSREGGFLHQDILDKLNNMSEHLEFIASRSPRLVERYRENLRNKMKELLSDASVDENRLIQEAAIYADRVCVDEEIVRLQSHIRGMKDELSREGSIGRKLDFLAQEMNRESNTILSKSDDAEVADHAIELKTEVEKIREQVQNIE